MREVRIPTCLHCGSEKVIRDDWTDPRGDVRDIWSALSEIWQSLKSRYEVKK